MAKREIRNILVTLDGSKNSLKALDMGIFLARQCNSRLIGLCVMYAPPRSEFTWHGEFEKGSKKEVKKFLEIAKVRSAKKGIEFKGKIIEGDIGFSIISFAHKKSNSIDMIVTSSRGRGNAREIFFGSVSNYIIHKSKLPVMIIK